MRTGAAVVAGVLAAAFSSYPPPSARHQGLSWAEIGTLLGVTRQTMHRKYRKVG
jgi:hypothetical protein